MKVKYKKTNSENGFALAMATMISIALLITFTSVYHYLNATQNTNSITIREDKSVQCANRGVNAAVNIIRDDPSLVTTTNWIDLVNPDPNIPPRSGINDLEPFIFKSNDINGKLECWTRLRARLVPPDDVFTEQVYLIESTSWLPSGSDDYLVAPVASPFPNVAPEAGMQSAVRVYSWVELSNISRYFAAFKGDLSISAPADLAEARVYGRHITFKNADAAGVGPILLDGADYEAGYETNNNATFSISGGGGDIEISNADGDPDPTDEPDEPLTQQGIPHQALAPMVFPTINDDFNYFAFLAGTPSQPSDPIPANYHAPPVFMNGGDFSGTVKAPSVFPSSSHNGTPTGDDLHHFYLSSGDVTIGDNGPVTVQGQVVIVSKTQITIHNDIFKENDHGENTAVKLTPTPPSPWDGGDDLLANVSPYDNNVNESSAHQLVLIAPIIYIDQDWCNGNNATPGSVNVPLTDDANTLTIQAILIAPNGNLAINGDETTSNCDEAQVPGTDNYTLNFNGAMWMANQPIGLPLFFATRNYAYDPTVKYDPPPLRNAFDVKKQIEIMMTEPGVLGIPPL